MLYGNRRNDVKIELANSADQFEGYCIDVFTAAQNLLPYALPYKLIPYGDGITNPKLVRLITTGVFDAAKLSANYINQTEP
ncbi:hypothetical protein Leryth_018534 [Lithospermum erythrorhizon]|nr:hypothetical protein Leryth_018534 [Lithospermum erythrorhizon]